MGIGGIIVTDMTAGAPVAAVETSVGTVGKEITGIVRVGVVITDVVVASMVEDMIERSKGVCQVIPQPHLIHKEFQLPVISLV